MAITNQIERESPEYESIKGNKRLYVRGMLVMGLFMVANFLVCAYLYERSVVFSKALAWVSEQREQNIQLLESIEGIDTNRRAISQYKGKFEAWATLRNSAISELLALNKNFRAIPKETLTEMESLEPFFEKFASATIGHSTEAALSGGSSMVLAQAKSTLEAKINIVANELNENVEQGRRSDLVVLCASLFLMVVAVTAVTLFLFRSLQRRLEIYYFLSKDSERKLRAIFNSTTDVNVFVDVNMGIQYFNSVAQKVFEMFSKKKMRTDMPIKDYLPDDWKHLFAKHFEEAKNGDSITFEKEMHVEGLASRWFEINFLPVMDDKIGFVGVSLNAVNIDKRKKAELKIFEQNKKLRRIAWQQSHEVRGPLSNIMGLIKLMKSKKEVININELLYIVNAMDKESTRLDEMVRRIGKAMNNEK